MSSTTINFLRRIPTPVRWLALPLASPITFVLVTVIGNIAAKIFLFIAGDRGFAFSENFFGFLIIPGVAAFSAVYVPAIIAPTYNKIVALVFAALWVALSGASSVWVFLGGDYKYFLVLVATIAGATLAALQEEHELVID